MSIKALITAGGTVEPIDDVRTSEEIHVETEVGSGLQRLSHFDVSNISKGKFGRYIAEALTSRGIETTIIARHELARSIDQSSPLLRVIPFRSFSDLHNAVVEELSRETYDLLLMAAAVSDYSPVPSDGKISSSDDEMIIRFKRNPKILDTLRELAGDACRIVGFKLLSGVAPAKLVAVAHKQNQRAKLDYTVGNDMQLIDWEHGTHPIVLVDKHGKSNEIIDDCPEEHWSGGIFRTLLLSGKAKALL